MMMMMMMMTNLFQKATDLKLFGLPKLNPYITYLPAFVKKPLTIVLSNFKD